MLGSPVPYKAMYETAGVRTTAHSRILADNVPKQDAETIRRLHAEGAVMLGKLATHEFAIGGPAFDLPWPPARNPWDPRRFTGGSSSGSGAAVAAGLALGALGSDTGGSIRLPAAYCGIAGIKPTPGLVPRRGVIPRAPSLHRGPMAGRHRTAHPARCSGRPRSGRSGLGAWPGVLRTPRRCAGCGLECCAGSTSTTCRHRPGC
jgi:aspartyl-tRNA(Asn)/glutamyl-tRNA(Gln) amidotransferase subunit A